MWAIVIYNSLSNLVPMANYLIMSLLRIMGLNLETLFNKLTALQMLLSNCHRN
jgi:hypothetical protein